MAIPGLNFLNMQAAGASSGGISFAGQNQQPFNPVESGEKNIFTSSSVGGINGANVSGEPTAVSGVASQSGEGLVGRLDRMDANILKPQHQDEYRANKLDLYA